MKTVKVLLSTSIFRSMIGYSKADEDNDGRLSIGELKKLTGQLLLGLGEPSEEALLEQFDLSGDGLVSQ